jgi:hypothetical protein
MMKLALIKEETTRKPPPQDIIHCKDDLSILKARRKFQISPLDGAQYANISSNLKQATRENNARYNSKMKIHHTPIVK